MKTLYTLLFILLFFPAFAQVDVIKDELPLFQGVVHAEGRTSADLYDALRAWVALSYNSAQHVIQMDDPVAGRIIVKGLDTYYFKLMGANVPNQFDYTLQIEVRDNRFRYTFEVIDATTGGAKMEILNSVLLAEHPYDIHGNPYKGKTLQRVTKQKEIHIETIKEYKEAIVNGMVAAVERAQTSEDW